MELKLKRSQRQGGMLGGKVFFAIDARADLTGEEKALVKKYALNKLSLYDSETRKKHAAAMERNLDDSGYGGGGFMKLAAGLGRAAMAALSLRITIESLMDGQHIECKDLDEMLGAEAAIREACGILKAYLDTAETFDGREVVIEF